MKKILSRLFRKKDPIRLPDKFIKSIGAQTPSELEQIYSFTEFSAKQGHKSIEVDLSYFQDLIVAATSSATLIEHNTLLKRSLNSHKDQYSALEDEIIGIDFELATLLNKFWDRASSKEKAEIKTIWPRWDLGDRTTGSFIFPDSVSSAKQIN